MTKAIEQEHYLLENGWRREDGLWFNNYWPEGLHAMEAVCIQKIREQSQEVKAYKW